MSTAEQQRKIRWCIISSKCMGFMWGGILGFLAFGFLHAALTDSSTPPFQWPWLMGVPVASIA